ncbi:MAG TPA: CocE/NonD family hydrolase [Thermoleophilaceae bacterium]|jgi:pimeloyl-ACP methyl ester carboxylesterase
MRRVASLAALLALASPAAASASPDAPFGHACTAQNGVRFCPTASDEQRVPSFDGLPMDVDVTLPAGGTAPYPTIIMLHGFPGKKEDFESASPEGTSSHTYHWNNTFYAQQGYAVVNASSRGFGRSCGVAESRTAPACDRGWFHPVADQRYEVHDYQHLLGLLVDEGVTDPDAIGVTGTSMGGGGTMQLAFLRDKIRKVDGTLAPWTSPAGKPMSVSAAYPRWGISDLVYSLVPNGRALDYAIPVKPESRSPIGVTKASVLNLLGAGGRFGFTAPEGVDPTADLTGWLKLLNAGEPYRTDAAALVDQVLAYKSATGISGAPPTPLLMLVGWTDPVFPPIEAIRPYNRLRAATNDAAEVTLQIGDVGHFTGGNPIEQYRVFNDDALPFFDRHLKGQGPALPLGAVTAFLQGCPRGTAGSAPIFASSYSKLARGSLVITSRGGRVTSSGGSARSAAAADPGQNPNRCLEVQGGSAKGTTLLRRTSPGFTMLGLPRVVATVETKGEFGQLDAILWEVTGSREKRRQRIVDFGVYRLTRNQKGRIVFQLHGNGYRFRKGSEIKLELRGRTPNLYRPSNGSFSVRLSDVSVEIPTRDKPSRSKGIDRRPPAP